jgi:hypothetical protein
VLHARVEINQRGGRAGFNDRLVDLAPGETLDGADIPPTRENEEFNCVADPSFAERRAEKSGNPLSSGSTVWRKCAG